MKPRHISLGIFSCLIVYSCFAEGHPSISAFMGKWTVADVLGYSEVSGGIPEAKRLLGKILTVSENQIDFDGEDCAPHGGFSVIIADTALEFDGDYGKFYIPSLGLPEKSIILNSPNCVSIYKSSDYSVTFGWNGVILRAYK